MGGEAENCPSDSVPDDIDITYAENCTISVFPNPANSNIHVSSVNSFTVLEIFTITGKRELLKNFDSSVSEISLPMELTPGIYIIKVTGESNIGIKKLIVE
jgi:hypothetical protein